ncbi:hypothetical protein M758_8G032800 [Ceratodon purpureus]|nr:hypothetical protein M758_8G032800 [Ceratodon purpureus]
MDDQSLELSRPRKRHRAQCSSSFAATDVDYDVFLNHRGPDVKAGFISHLDEALRTAGLNPFLDKASLRKGHPAFRSINDALEAAKIHVAIVSKGYAESKYCLTELVAMMRSGKPVIPVFYDVEPAHLRLVENGPFAAAFEKHKLKRTPEQVEEWRDALLKLAEITWISFRLSDYKNEAELKQEVVNVVLSFTRRDQVVPIEHHLVGVEDQMNACIRTMKEFMFGPTRLLGLVGMGGIGKTTLAKAIYNHFVGCKKFQAMSFLQVDHNSLSSMEEVGSDLSKRLQKQLLMDIFHIPHKNQGSYKCWFDKLSSQGPILVVLDDLCRKSEFDQVILNMSLLALGSCIIVTSRDRHVLNEIDEQCNFFLHEVTPLASDDSLQLFNFHAFGDGEAPPKFKNLANYVSKACGGLPLALKVVGSSLIGKKSDEDLECIWPEAADVLKEDGDVMDVLRWSYNCLSKQEKMMFLDIACIFCGWWRDEAMEVWKSCKESSCCGLRTPHTSLAKLIDKSLIFIDVTKEKQGGGVLAMHGLLQELGRNIGMDDGSHIRADKATCMVEAINQGPMKVRALNLANGGENELEFEYFSKMTNLHFFVLDGCFIHGGPTIISKKLRSLRRRNIKMKELQSFISTIMSELGIQQKPRKQELGVEQLIQIFEGNVYGVVVGRLDTRSMQVQVILSDLKTMVDLTGVGIETQKLVTVTLGGDSTKVIMSVFEEIDCKNSSANPFYLLHLDEDVVANQNHSVGTQGDFLSHHVYRVHILAKLLLLMECEELGDEILWLRIKELPSFWNLKTLMTAILEFESISKGDGRYQERGSGASTEKGGCSQQSNSSFSNDRRSKNARSNQDTPADEKNEDLASGGDDKEDGRDSSGGKSLSTSTDSMDQESISIEVRPGFDTFKKKMGDDWPYKSICANVTPCITVSFPKTVPFRNGPNKIIKGREVHVKLEVNLELGDSGPVRREGDGQFAWFYDYFEFSIQCMDKNAAQFKPCSSLIHELKDQNLTRGRSSTLNSGQESIQGQGGVKLGPSTLAQATGQVTYTRTGGSTTTQVEENIVSNRIQSAQGFNVVHNIGGGEMPKIGGRFSYGDTNIRSQCLREDGTCKNWAYSLPICSSQDVTIEGTFQPLEDGKPYYNYTLNCKRDIKGWFWEELEETKEKKRSFTSKFSRLSCISDENVSINVDAVRSSKDDKRSVKKTWIEQIFEQAFHFDIYINHAMIHIYELAAQHPSGIPAIGRGVEYENVIKSANYIYPGMRST